MPQACKHYLEDNNTPVLLRMQHTVLHSPTSLLSKILVFAAALFTLPKSLIYISLYEQVTIIRAEVECMLVGDAAHIVMTANRNTRERLCLYVGNGDRGRGEQQTGLVLI